MFQVTKGAVSPTPVPGMVFATYAEAIAARNALSKEDRTDFYSAEEIGFVESKQEPVAAMWEDKELPKVAFTPEMYGSVAIDESRDPLDEGE